VARQADKLLGAALTFALRPYQSAACDAALAWMRQSVDPCLIDAAPAAGKSYMIAQVAAELHRISGGKRVLCLAPSAELVKQNYAKYALTGERASIYSASAGAKSTRHVVVFGTPGTVKNSISRFMDDYAGVIVDECHGITPTIKSIIDAMRQGNPRLRVLGLSGTPFRLGSGYVFQLWPDNRANGDDTARAPYFTKCVYRVSAREMLDAGFITPMTIGAINSAAYDTSGVVVKANGQLDYDTVERAFEGHGRETAGAVADVIEQARGRPGGIMYFAATVRHAHEILASLPPKTSALVTGDDCIMRGAPASRNAVISAYRARKVRHLVSVGTLTTGFDVEHTETIALLRYTESAALLQQILGRAWRLCDGKEDCLLLDYASNVERHFPDGDIYNPVIKAGKGGGEGGTVDAECPECGHVNAFTLNMEYAEYPRDKHGYCLDIWGAQIQTEYGPMPAHYGRRCFGQIRTGDMGRHDRCGYRWTGKECPECAELNDIAARYCYSCKAEIVNPNDKLIAEFKAMKRDPTRPQTDKVIGMTCKEGVSARGNKTVRVDWVTPYRQFSTWFMPEARHSRGLVDYMRFMDAAKDGQVPETITYQKEAESGFFRIISYNQPADVEPCAAIAA